MSEVSNTFTPHRSNIWKLFNDTMPRLMILNSLLALLPGLKALGNISTASEFTNMLMESVVTQPQLVSPFTLYRVLIAGVATGLDIYALSNPDGGNHVNTLQLVWVGNW